MRQFYLKLIEVDENISGYLCSEETIALLLHIVIDNSGEFFLPNFQPIYIHIVLNILERSPVSVNRRLQLSQFGHQFTGFGFRVENEAVVQGSGYARNEFFSDSVF